MLFVRDGVLIDVGGPEQNLMSLIHNDNILSELVLLVNLLENVVQRWYLHNTGGLQHRFD